LQHDSRFGARNDMPSHALLPRESRKILKLTELTCYSAAHCGQFMLARFEPRSVLFQSMKEFMT
jgi:hypothetical protein